MDGVRICHTAVVERSSHDPAPSNRGDGTGEGEGGWAGQEVTRVAELPGRPPTHGTTPITYGRCQSDMWEAISMRLDLAGKIWKP